MSIRSFPGRAAAAIIYLALFFLTTQFTARFVIEPGALLWFGQAGLDLSLLWLGGPVFAPLIFAAHAAGRIFLLDPVLNPGLPWAPILVAAAFVAAIEALAVAGLKKRLGDSWENWGLRSYGIYAAILLLVSLLVSGFRIADFALAGLLPWKEFFHLWWHGLVASYLGALNVSLFLMADAVPLIRRLLQGGFPRPTGRQVFRLLGEAVSVPLVLWFCFISPLAGPSEYLYLSYIPILAIALHHGARGAGSMSLAMNLSLMTLVSAYDPANLAKSQLFMLVLSLTGLFLGILNQDRQRAERTMRQSEEKYRQLVELSPDAIVVHSQGRILFANSAALRMVGARGPAELLGKRVLDFVVPEYQSLVQERICRMQQGNTVQLQEEFIRLSGDILNVEVAGTPIFYFNHPAIQLVIRDITSRKQAEMALAASEKLFRAAVDSYPYGFALYSHRAGEISLQFLNAYLMRLLHLRNQAVAGRRMEELLPPEAVNVFLPQLRRAVETRDSQQTEGLVFGRFMQITFVPLLDDEGGVYQILGTSYDITALKQAEEVLRRDNETLERLITDRTARLVSAQQDLEKSRRLSEIGSLAATVAHELRNPLSVIRLAVRNLRVSPADPERHLDRIEKKVAESDQTINNLLSYSRLKTPHFERTNLDNLLLESLELAQAKSGKTRVRVEFGLEALSRTPVEVDPFQIQEVFQNVFDNAFQAVPDEGGTITVWTGPAGAGCLEIRIRDNGIGFEAGEAEKLFEPFYTKKSKGTGLGLAISRELIHLQNGEITIEGRKNQGATVHLILPWKQSATVVCS